MPSEYSTASAHTPVRDASGLPRQAAHARVVAAYVRKLQRHQNHEPCFMTDARYQCREMDCRWRAECMRLVAECFR